MIRSFAWPAPQRRWLGLLLAALVLAFAHAPLAGLAHSLEHGAQRAALLGAQGVAGAVIGAAAAPSAEGVCAFCLAFAALGAKAGTAAVVLAGNGGDAAIAAPALEFALAPLRLAFRSRAPPVMV